MTLWFALAIILIFAHTVETATGFGATVMAVSLGAHFLPVEQLVVILIMLAWLQSAWIVSRGYKSINRRLLLGRILPFAGVGIPAGLFLFYYLGGESLMKALGIFVIGASLLELYRLYRSDGATGELPPVLGGAALFAGGVIHGMYSSGGPLIVYYLSRKGLAKSEFRSTLSTLWLILSTILIMTHTWKGALVKSSVLWMLSLLPALAAGIVVGELVHKRVNERAFRIVVQAVLFVTGVSLLF